MKYFYFLFFIYISTLSYSQGNVSYGIVHRLPHESIGDFVTRIVIEEQDLDEDDTISPWEIMHAPVEIKFGLKEDKRIVFIFKNSLEDFSEVGLLTHRSDDIYNFESFGELSYGFHPSGDTILSIFTYDYDEDGFRELLIIGKGGEKSTNEDGMTGCCVDVYSTDIFKEYLDGKNYQFSNLNSSILNDLKTAKEVKAAIERYRINTDFVLKGVKEEAIKVHLKKLDSIDKKQGLSVERKIIDNIYEISFGQFDWKSLVVSFVQKIGGTERYYTGVFLNNYNGTYSYAESFGVSLNDYSEFKDYKVESIFAYDADKFGDTKVNELIILLSANNLNDSGERSYAAFVGFVSYDYTRVILQEGWYYGIHDEKTAAEIKKAIEYYHIHKYDEDEDSRD